MELHAAKTLTLEKRTDPLGPLARPLRFDLTCRLITKPNGTPPRTGTPAPALALCCWII
jgi:hypothetical protein